MLSPSVSVSVRRGRQSDAEVLAGVFSNAWHLTYRGIIPDPYLKYMADQRGPQWWRRAVRNSGGLVTLVVCDKVVGYATFGAARDQSDNRGEIFELYVDPDYQGLGFGEYLFESCRHRLDLRSRRGLVVWALEDNTPAMDFYWHRGGRPFGESCETIAGRQLTKVGFSWP